MPRSVSVSVPKRLSFELEDALPRGVTSPREYDSWPCDSFFLLPDAVLTMDAGAFRADLKTLDPVLSASLPDWPLEDAAKEGSSSSVKISSSSVESNSDGSKCKPSREKSFERRNFTLLHNHKGLLVRSSGKGTVLIGGGGDTTEKNSTAQNTGGLSTLVGSSTSKEEQNLSSSNGPTKTSQQLHASQQQQEQPPHHSFKATSASSKDPIQKDGIGFGLGHSLDVENLSSSSFSPNELFFGGGDSGPDRSSGLCYKDREERVRQLRERQLSERHQKLEELKEQAAAAQRFREQQEALRRQRLDDMRSKDSERRTQVEERKRVIQQADQDRREAVLRKSAERENRLELKRRQERSNVVFAFGSSTPRMLDPKENLQTYFGTRRATSTTNVNLSDSSSSSVRRTSEVQDAVDLSRKRATSAHSLNRKLEGDETQRPFIPPPPTAARRRTDLLPAFPSLRDANIIIGSSTRSSPRHRSPGVRSGTATPGSSSRPTSALSQASGGSAQVMLRSRTSPRKPRPLSIAGTTLSSADKPRETVIAAALPHAVASPALSPDRESRPIDRKSTTTATPKLSRAKSAGSDRSAPSTPAKTPRGSTPKRTPAQVKAENAAKKAAERSKTSQKLKSTPRTTPLQSPSVESKPLPSFEKKIEKMETQPDAAQTESLEISLEQEVNKDPIDQENKDPIDQENKDPIDQEIKDPIDQENKDPIDQINKDPIVSDNTQETFSQQETETTESSIDVPKTAEVEKENSKVSDTLQPQNSDEVNDDLASKTTEVEDKNETSAQRAAEKPVTGYASEEVYKAALAEKRRQAREAKERELELERQKKLEEEERERKEEEDYLRLMEEQKRAEEERLRKAIEEAERQRETEALKKEEEEKQRIEVEKIEHQKKLEAEEKMRKEEEDRQMRKSRVAAIMSRTRGRASGSTPSKAEMKTPSEEGKSMNDSIMSSSMTESLINNLSSSMTDSMIVQAIESHQTQRSASETSQILENDEQQQQQEGDTQSLSTQSSQPLSEVSSQPLSDLSSQSLSDKSSQSKSNVDITPISNIDTKSEESQYQSESITVTKTTVTTTEGTHSAVENESLLLEMHVNGNTPTIPMDTTPTSQVVDLLGSYNGVNGINQNGVHSAEFQSSERHDDNQFGSLDPLNSTSQTILTTEAKGESFDQIIDLNQVKLTNEDAVNSNPPPPIIAFEENLNKKSQQQSQDTSSNVPDLLL